MRENKREKVSSKQLICFVSEHSNKTEISRLPKSRLVSSVNKPTSVGIEPVTLFKSITII